MLQSHTDIAHALGIIKRPWAAHTNHSLFPESLFLMGYKDEERDLSMLMISSHFPLKSY